VNAKRVRLQTSSGRVAGPVKPSKPRLPRLAVVWGTQEHRVGYDVVVHDPAPMAVLESEEQILHDGGDIAIGQSPQIQVRGALVPAAQVQHQVASLKLIAVEVQCPHDRRMRKKREHSELMLQIGRPLLSEGTGLRDGLEHDLRVPTKVNTEEVVEPIAGRAPLLPLIQRAESGGVTTWIV